MTRPRKNPGASGIQTGSFRSRGGRFNQSTGVCYQGNNNIINADDGGDDNNDVDDDDDDYSEEERIQPN